MPYRRLPNTDAARLRALKIASEKGKELPPFKLAFSQSTFQKLQSFLPSFEKAMQESRQAYSKQVEKSKGYIADVKKARIYISHFIQVINMAIARGDLPASERKYYGLQEYGGKLPLFNTESDLIKWGEKLIHGDIIRSMEARAPITNPTIAVVKVWYEKFLEAYKFQKMLQKNHQRTQEHLEVLRQQANSIIVNIWDEVEDTYKLETDKKRREKSGQYGIKYVFRKNELANSVT